MRSSILRFRSHGAGEGSSTENRRTVVAWSWQLTTALLSFRQAGVPRIAAHDFRCCAQIDARIALVMVAERNSTGATPRKVARLLDL